MSRAVAQVSDLVSLLGDDLADQTLSLRDCHEG